MAKEVSDSVQDIMWEYFGSERMLKSLRRNLFGFEACF
jgi:hypothetical protein